MSIFATVHATAPASPRAALALAFPLHQVPDAPPFRVTLTALEATAIAPAQPNFLAETFGFDPTVSMYLVLDKHAPARARAELSDAVRAFVRGSRGDLVVLYVDTPIVKRDATGGSVKRSYEDLVGAEGFQVLDAVEIGVGSIRP